MPTRNFTVASRSIASIERHFTARARRLRALLFKPAAVDRRPAVSDAAARVLAYAYAHLAEHTFQPSYRDIGLALGTESIKDVHRLIDELADAGYVVRGGRGRGLKLR